MKLRRRSTKSFNMPDVSPLIIPFITATPLEDNSQKKILKELPNSLNEIENKKMMLIAAKDSLELKQRDLISSFDNVKYPYLASPEYVWSKQKCQRLYIKYFKWIIKFYDEKICIINILIEFIKTCISQSTPIKIEMKNLHDFTSVAQDKNIDEHLIKYTRMNSYVNYLESKGLDGTTRYGDVKRSEVWGKMKEIATYYEQQGPYEGSSNRSRYFPPNEFDELFMKFILSTKISDKFLNCIESMPIYGTYEDFKKSNNELLLQSISPEGICHDNILNQSLKNIQVNNGAIDIIKSQNSFEAANTTTNNNNSSNNKNNSSNKNAADDNNDNEMPKIPRVSFGEVPDVQLDLDPNLNFDDDDNEDDEKKDTSSSALSRKRSLLEEAKLQSLMDQGMDSVDFRQFIVQLFRLIKENNPCTQAMLQLFHCSVIRILFDFYYVRNSAIFYGRTPKENYMKACENVLNETPLQMDISSKFFAEGEPSLQIRKIIENDPILQTASSTIYTIQFLINPLDMAIQINRSFRIIQESVNSKNYDGSQQNTDISATMTSDDFINMLKPLYATHPYVCPSGICRFIELFCELFQLFDSLSYGLTTFSIVLKDIEESAKKLEESASHKE